MLISWLCLPRFASIKEFCRFFSFFALPFLLQSNWFLRENEIAPHDLWFNPRNYQQLIHLVWNCGLQAKVPSHSILTNDIIVRHLFGANENSNWKKKTYTQRTKNYSKIYIYLLFVVFEKTFSIAVYDQHKSTSSIISNCFFLISEFVL